MDNIDKYIKILYKLTNKSFKLNEIAVGAIVIYNKKIIGVGYNNRQKKHDVCGHAEINAIRKAEKYIKDWRLNDCILFCTLKPCNMCAEVINSSRISNVYYLLDQEDLKYEYENFKKIDYKNEYVIKIKELFDNSFKKLR